MPRPLRALDPDAGPLQRFAHDLRELRDAAGAPTYRELSDRTRFSLSAISEAARGERLPSLDVTCAFVDACGGDREEWTRRWHEVSTALAAADGRGEDAPPPYRGLAAYEAADADRFFGRERLLDDLLARLADRRFLAVFGPSGIGKSSLLRAGLVPAARAGRLDGAGGVTLVTAPADHPPERLAGVEGLLVVDQFEEVFSAGRSPGERQRFIDALLRARRPGSGLRVVIGVRADFLGHCARHAGLAAAISDNSLLVGPMTAEELRAAIVKPAARAGLSVDPALVATVVRDAGEEPGALPLLSHVLQETWRRRRGKHLTIAGYHAAGGLHGAVARTAEQVYRELPARERDGVRRVCLRLVVPGVGTEDTGRTVRNDDLPASDRAVVERLVGARLLTRDGDGVRLAHEALLRSWPRLREWLDAERDGLRLRRDLTIAAAAWEELDRDPGALWRGARLALAREWAHDQELAKRERSFLDASVAAEADERAAAARRNRQLRVLSAVLALLLVAAVAAGGFAWQQREQAVSRQLAAEATGLARVDVEAATRSALEAYEHAPTAEARSALLSLAGREPYHARLTGHVGMVKSVAFSPDGGTLASASLDHTVRLWDVPEGTHRATLRGHEREVRTIAYSPDGRLIASADSGGQILLWDARDGRRLRVLEGHDGGIIDGVAFSPDGSRLASAGMDHTAAVWDVRSGRKLSELRGYGGRSTEVAYSPDGRTVAVAGDDGRVALWDVSGTGGGGEPDGARAGAVRELRASGVAVMAVAFSPDGGLLATAGEDRTVSLWDTRRWVRVAAMTEHVDSVRHLAFTGDSRALVSAGYDDVAILWNVDRRAMTVRLTGHVNGLFGVAASRDGRYMASAGEDETILLWDRTKLPLIGHTGRAATVAFAPDGGQIASGGADSTLHLWDLADGTGTGVPAPRAVPAAEVRGVSSVDYTPDGSMVVTGDQDGRVRLWDPDSGRRLASLRPHAGAGNTLVDFSPDGRLLVTGGLEGRVMVWDVATRDWRATLKEEGQPLVYGVEFSPDGTLIATAGDDGRVVLYDVAHGGEVASLHGHERGVEDVAFSPDGRLLASAGGDGRVVLWNVARRAKVAELPGTGAVVHAVAFSPDGRFLATGTGDHSVTVWSVAGRERWATLTGHEDIVTGVAFSPDGRTLASSGDHTITLWPLDPEEAAGRLRAQLR